jgi:hypothetical protein
MNAESRLKLPWFWDFDKRIQTRVQGYRIWPMMVLAKASDHPDRFRFRPGRHLMRSMGLHGVIRGRSVKTTVQDKSVPCPLDHVNRQFKAPAPNVLWVSDFTYVSTWAGFVCVAFVIDVYARRIVGWRVSRTQHTGFVLDARDYPEFCVRGLFGFTG